MAEAYPVELRERVVKAYEAGQGSYPTIASKFLVGEATVRRWVGQGAPGFFLPFCLI
jgi:transposase